MVRKTEIALAFALALSMAIASPVRSAEPVVPDSPPEPPVVERGIWGAIAFSPASDGDGFFWGADKRQEAESLALKHCERQSNAQCQLAITFRTHRHWTDDDGSGFPYEHCAALSVATGSDGKVAHWGAASSRTAKQAEDLASAKCGDGVLCKTQRLVCT